MGGGAGSQENERGGKRERTGGWDERDAADTGLCTCANTLGAVVVVVKDGDTGHGLVCGISWYVSQYVGRRLAGLRCQRGGRWDGVGDRAGTGCRGLQG